MKGGSNMTAIVPVLKAIKNNFSSGLIVDIGAGKGKYGVLIREYIDGIEALDAVEPEEVLAKEAYSTIYRETVQDFLKRNLQYDLAIMIAVLCNFSHKEGKSILEKVKKLCGKVIITIEKEQHGGKTQWTPAMFQAKYMLELPYEWLIIL